MPKILLVEDNEMNRDMLSRRLIRRGFEVVLAVDGAEGVRLGQSESPDLILMDVTLPVLDGCKPRGRLKAIPKRDPSPSSSSPRLRWLVIANRPLPPVAMTMTPNRWISFVYSRKSSSYFHRRSPKNLLKNGPTG